MRRPRTAHPPVERSAFAGFRFPPEVITVAVRWYLRYGLSARGVNRRRRPGSRRGDRDIGPDPSVLPRPARQPLDTASRKSRG
jgi:hypothetical protein